MILKSKDRKEKSLLITVWRNEAATYEGFNTQLLFVSHHSSPLFLLRLIIYQWTFSVLTCGSRPPRGSTLKSIPPFLLLTPLSLSASVSQLMWPVWRYTHLFIYSWIKSTQLTYLRDTTHTHTLCREDTHTLRDGEPGHHSRERFDFFIFTFWPRRLITGAVDFKHCWDKRCFADFLF